MIVAGLVLASSAGAQVLPKHGACPDRYHGEGSYCVPYANAMPAISKGSAACPSGSFASGSYCVGHNAGTVMIERPSGASCPSGWRASGSGCVR